MSASSWNGKKVGDGRIEKTMGAVSSLAGETAAVGRDAFSPVTDDCDPWDHAFTGMIERITIDLKRAGTWRRWRGVGSQAVAAQCSATVIPHP